MALIRRILGFEPLFGPTSMVSREQSASESWRGTDNTFLSGDTYVEDLEEHPEKKHFKRKPKEQLQKPLVKKTCKLDRFAKGKYLPKTRDTVKEHWDEAGERFFEEMRAESQNDTRSHNLEDEDMLEEDLEEVRFGKGEN